MTAPAEELKCPRCIDETLARSVGNLLICPNCDVIFVEPSHVNNPVDRIQVLKAEA